MHRLRRPRMHRLGRPPPSSSVTPACLWVSGVTFAMVRHASPSPRISLPPWLLLRYYHQYIYIYVCVSIDVSMCVYLCMYVCMYVSHVCMQGSDLGGVV